MDFYKVVRRVVHTASAEERKQTIVEISDSASPGFDFFVMVVLSCSIATLGLITNSPAVIIGAMLVAPLMSPIVGIGLASITGEPRLAEASLSSLLRGALLAVLLAIIMTFINRYLPFVVLQELPTEVLARTHPSPIDLGIAMAGGLAAAYAMTRPNLSAALPGVAIATALMPPLCTIGIGIALGRWDVAGGASLLFVTNAITIAFAAALVFFLRGFSPRASRHGWRLPRSLVISAILTLVLLIPLTYYSVRFFSEASQNREINDVVKSQIVRLNGAELVELSVTRTDGQLDMVITLRSSTPLSYQQVVELQKNIVASLKQPVSLKVNQVFAEQLDPLIPPTPTPTLKFTATPSSIPTLTPSITSSPTRTPTLTPTPALVQAGVAPLPSLKLYQTPGGPVIGQINNGQTLSLLYGKQDLDGVIWVQVIDNEGRIGWVPEVYIRLVTPTPSRTPIATVIP
jgi:uncharacterized hydrophobic protein (TIGR00271 family)